MVMARDGAIARIKLPMGRLTAYQALALADIAAKSGSGAVELSIRSNIQLRAIAPQSWDATIAALHAAGLGANTPAVDDIRNIMVSPAAGIDQGQACDVSPLAHALLERLESETAFHALSPKFSFQIDGGENCAMISHPGDIWLSVLNGGRHFAFALASSPDGSALGIVEAENALPLIDTILRLFLKQSAHGAARMKHLFERVPQEHFLAELKVQAPFVIKEACDWQRTAPEPQAHLGVHQQEDGKFYIGAMPFLGRLDSTQLKSLAALAQKTNGGEIRLTPWQGILLPSVDAAQCDAVLEELHALGLATDAHAPQARLRACTGVSGCASALSDTQADAREIASLLDDDTSAIHLSGCAKSCAALAPLPRTLLARGAGRYDVFFAVEAGPSRFGRLLASDVSLQTAARLLHSQERKT